VRLVLRLEARAEPQRRDPDRDPRQLVRDTDDVLEPAPQLSRADEGGAEADARDGGGGQDGDPRDAVAVQIAEEGGSVAVDGERVEQARAGEEGMVAGGDHRGHDHGVDEGAGDLCAGHLEDEGEG